MSLPGKIVVVIPTYNERENITAAMTSVHDQLPDADILVVDDSSPDGTGDLVHEFAASHSFVALHTRSTKQGLGAAYFDGFRRALASGYEWVVQMDADGSHKPEYLPAFMRALAEGADLVVGSRYVRDGGTEGWPLSRRLVSRGGSLYAATLLGLPVSDVTGGFKGWRGELLSQVVRRDLLLTGFGFQIELTYRAHLLGAAIVEVPIIFPDRQLGESKMSAGIFKEAFLGVLRLRKAGKSLLE